MLRIETPHMYQEPLITIDELAAGDDKDEAAFFVGRGDIIAGIEATVAGIESRIKNKISNTGLQPGQVIASQKTWLIQGAPGAGKSALLSHLQNRWKAKVKGPVVVEIDPKDLSDESMVTRTIADCIIPEYGAEILNTVRTVEGTLGFDMIVKGEGKVTDSEQSSSLALQDLAKLYNKNVVAVSKRLFEGSSTKRPKPRPIVVTIDEVQVFKPEAAALLFKLHNGKHGLPILAVLAGLAYSKSMLAKENISRFATSNGRSHVQTLGPLETGEAAEAVRAMLNGYRIKGRDNSNLPEKIGEWSDEWPQHLFHYMAGLANELKNNNFDLARVDESALRSFGDGCRLQYYRSRLEDSTISKCTALLAEVAQTIGASGCHLADLEAMLEDRIWDKSNIRATMPKKMEPTEFIEAMIYAGMVHRVDAILTIPIPSFRKYLIERGK